MTPKEACQAIELLKDWLKVVEMMENKVADQVIEFLPELRIMKAATRSFMEIGS